MDLLTDLQALFIVAMVSALAPMLAAVLPGKRVPQVVLLIVGGMLVGPQVLDLVEGDSVQLIANVGLGFVFLLAGFEIEPRLMVTQPGRLALVAWVASAVLAAVIIGALAWSGFVHAYVPVALALTTTALGTVLPILRERGMLKGPFRTYFMASGAVGEVLPILAIAVFLGVKSSVAALVSLAAIGVVAVLLAVASRWFHGRAIARIVAEGSESTGQTTLRWSIVLLLGLLVLAGEFGLDVVLGAFLAGVVLRRWAPGDVHSLESKLDAVGYGFFIPVFFVSAGVGVDLDSIKEAPLRLAVFFVLLLVVRGLPTFFAFRRVLDPRRRLQLTFCTATSLPLIVALTEIGLENGTMLPENAAALVGAGVLSVLVFPLAAVLLERGTSADGVESGSADEQGFSDPDGPKVTA
jgi:Kef-type K+ transport system membrane component KefB